HTSDASKPSQRADALPPTLTQSPTSTASPLAFAPLAKRPAMRSRSVVPRSNTAFMTSAPLGPELAPSSEHRGSGSAGPLVLPPRGEAPKALRGWASYRLPEFVSQCLHRRDEDLGAALVAAEHDEATSTAPRPSSRRCRDRKSTRLK